MFGGEHKQTDIAQSAIFTTGSMRASRFYPAILFSFLIMYGDYSFDLSSKIRIISSYIFSPFTQIEYLAKDSFNSFDSYFSSQKKLSEEIDLLRNQIRDLENQNLALQNTKTSLNELEELFDLSKSFQERKIFLGLRIFFFPENSYLDQKALQAHLEKFLYFEEQDFDFLNLLSGFLINLFLQKVFFEMKNKNQRN